MRIKQLNEKSRAPLLVRDERALGNRDRTLQFAEDGTFQITVFSDLHYAESESKDARTAEVVSKVLEHDFTQLVVLNGDLITGDVTDIQNSTDYLDQVVAPIVKADLPWASTYGNHDNQPNLLSENILQREKTYNNSLTQNMVTNPSPFSGVTNYYLPVYAASGPQETPELILWFFDSKGGYWYGGEYGKQNSRPDWVDDSVARWFNETDANLKKQYGKAIPSLAFFHIPVNATLAFQKTEGVDHSTEPGVNEETVISQGRMYNTSYNDWDVPFMTALLNTEGLPATFSGHDHDNDWCFKWNGTISNTTLPGNGVNMCYGRHTGYGGYGNLARGGRHILLNQNNLNDVVTWIRLESGLVTENVTLNATYGQDEYHPLPFKEAVGENQGYGRAQDMPSILILLLLVIYLPLRILNY